MLTSRTITVAIKKSIDVVYAYASLPENFSKWAESMGGSLEFKKGQWVMQTPDGSSFVEFTPENIHGVIDHTIYVGGDPVYVAMRVVHNGDGSEVVATIFRQPELSDEEFEQDMAAVRRDLEKLRDTMEERRNAVLHVDFKPKRK